MARRGIDLCFSVGRASRATTDAMARQDVDANRRRHFDTCDEAAEVIGPMLVNGDVMLVKGSRAVRLERFLDAVRKNLAARHTAARRPHRRARAVR